MDYATLDTDNVYFGMQLDQNISATDLQQVSIQVKPHDVDTDTTAPDAWYDVYFEVWVQFNNPQDGYNGAELMVILAHNPTLKIPDDYQSYPYQYYGANDSSGDIEFNYVDTSVNLDSWNTVSIDLSALLFTPLEYCIGAAALGAADANITSIDFGVEGGCDTYCTAGMSALWQDVNYQYYYDTSTYTLSVNAFDQYGPCETDVYVDGNYIGTTTTQSGGPDAPVTAQETVGLHSITVDDSVYGGWDWFLSLTGGNPNGYVFEITSDTEIDATYLLNPPWDVRADNLTANLAGNLTGIFAG